MLRIALIQQRCEKAAIEQNLESLSQYLAEAARRNVDIAGFPEMSITGYADPNRYPEAVIRLDGPEMREFLRRTESFPGTVLAGLIEENLGSKPFITHVAARRGVLEGVYRKVTIADDETAWFSPGDVIPLFQHDGIPFGISICADINNPQVFSALRRQGARIVFELAAPGLYGDQATRDWQSGYRWWEGECQKNLSAYAREHGYWVAVATQAGRTIDEDFPGGGYLFAPGGKRVFATCNELPCAVFLAIDLEKNQVSDCEIIS
ncbi:MAG: carbon-nitrogen hydrolase family protein [Chloroflexi bacterium]|nr:carbon-nitrogen hydrolase family protein [Chloroflexota bacterium]